MVGGLSSRARRPEPRVSRLFFLMVFFVLIGLILLGRFFQLQVLESKSYKVLALDQHETQAKLVPRRGSIFVKDRIDGSLYPVATDRDSWQAYVVTRELKDATSTAREAAGILGLPEEEVVARFTSSTRYFILAKDLSLDAVDALKKRRLPGVGVSKGLNRFYPEAGFGGQLIGFVSGADNQREGKYGIEGAYQAQLAGEFGSLIAEKDAAGRRLTIGNLEVKEARDGSHIVLTIDRTIQYEACRAMHEAVKRFEAQSASVVIIEPQTGAILAMCAAPDFDPSFYNKVDSVAVFNNPVTFYQFEPGSIFKPLTLAAGLDAGKITPQTTYEDKGEETMDGFTVRNSDKLAHGLQTMTQVLEESLNTGTIFVQRLLGVDVFRDYVVDFGFGEKTGIGFQAEARGDVSSLSRPGRIFGATASYGQGVSVTPLQMVTAFAALGNGGKLMKPYIVQEIRHSNGVEEKIAPQMLRQVISPRASRLISGMLVSVVERGHGKRAGVSGHYVAGKTGTAQIPDPRGGGYLKEKDATIGSFAGYAPADNPRFAMLVKIDRPKTVQFAESSAAPVFGELAAFLLKYLQVPPER